MKDKRFDERLSASRDARQAMAAKFLQRPAVDDPAVLARQAERAAISAAREARNAEREIKRLEDEKLEAQRQIELKAQAAAQAVLEEQSAAEKALEEERLEVERKAARDARYAARKARK